jgi:hypothetical protein
MEENFKTISDALAKAGFKTSLESTTGKPLDFKITPYSLNTKLSFRFENLDAFRNFLVSAGVSVDEKRSTQIEAGLLELGLDPIQFFYVNFFEAGKEEEM